MSQTKLKGYIYPSAIMQGGRSFPYIRHFIRSLQDKVEFVNENFSSGSRGIFDILKYIHSIDIVFLNWPEEIPERKGGVLQSIFYFFLVYYLKFRKISICWTCHNKVSHAKGKLHLKNYLRRFSAQNADYILTHAMDGIKISEELATPKKKEVFFFHHPVLPAVLVNHDRKKSYDLLLWGMVEPYKGIIEFLDFIRKEDLNNIRILVAGKISQDSYRDKLLMYQNDNIKIINRFIPETELQDLISGSKAVLFTYLEYSILSSGALMDTLRYSPLIFGPKCGAFKDLGEEGLIMTYRDYSDLKDLILYKIDLKPDITRMDSFIKENSWENFGKRLSELIGKNNTI